MIIHSVLAVGVVTSPAWGQAKYPAWPYAASYDSATAAPANNKLLFAGFKSSGLTAPIPGCTYSEPQVASVGLTEAQAMAAGTSVKVGRFPFRVNGKAIAAGDTEGFIKTVFDASTGALLGAHLIGAEVTEMIQGFALAITMEATEEDLIAAVFPHPTLSEVMHESSLDAYGRALHM